MNRRVQVRGQVKDFLERLAPEPRRRLKLALRALGDERGDRLALRERLTGFHRLRVGGYRIIFRYLPGSVTECVFAEERSLVYQLFEREVLERLRREDQDRRGRDESAIEEAPAKYGTKRKRRKKKVLTRRIAPARR